MTWVPGAFGEPRDVLLDRGSATYEKFLCGASLSDPLPSGIGIDAVYHLCAFLPAIGLLAWFLPRLAPDGPTASGH